MQFNSIAFLIFLFVIFLLNYTFFSKKQNILLLISSLAFYALWDVKCVPILLFTILVTYCIGQMLGNEKYKRYKSFLFACGLILVLSMWAFFKYDFTSSIIVPIGFSFYMLNIIGYLVDVYKGEIKPEYKFIDYGLYVSFFPAIISGPILRSNKFIPQIKKERQFDYESIVSGIYMFALGIYEKMIVANRLGYLVDTCFKDLTKQRGAALLFAIILYGMQLYCDFDGYSNMAIGSAKILGINIDRNFNQPYFATSIKDFWRRWHVSLSTWLKDYIYIPLGGSRKGRFRKYFNLLVTFIVSGLWHGTGIQFLFWGFLHGTYQIAGDLKSSFIKPIENKLVNLIRMIMVFILVDFGWLFFRAKDMEQAAFIIKRIITSFELKNTIYYGNYLFGRSKQDIAIILIELLLVFIIDFFKEKGIQFRDKMLKIKAPLRSVMYVIFVLFIIVALIRDFGAKPSSFIYAGF